MPRRPFIDSATGELKTTQLLQEALPLAKLIAVFVGLALVPYALAFFLFGRSALGALFSVLGQFVLAVGTGVVLMYCVARGTTL
ncbi:hypothetical protein KTS45_08430 [Halomicroarcula limicola]|uniref:Uncharacterized protein n=1 Tax=Haloarcula limicola TaxID=1429915 RepID=A0A8J7Y3T2_9EURY|nr:hypothetical protein [Halomicroarcula limicola]MBV0924225.1 hypothetical protein [Halomicroarcula limicola]